VREGRWPAQYLMARRERRGGGLLSLRRLCPKNSARAQNSVRIRKDPGIPAMSAGTSPYPPVGHVRDRSER